MADRPHTSPLIVPGGSTAVERIAPAGDKLLAVVRQAAEGLVERLRAAEQATGGFQDAALASQLVAEAGSALLARLAATNCWGEANRIPSSELWRVAGEWLLPGELQKQARFKPRGYAGDYDLLAKICDGWRCEHPLGRAFDDFFQSQAAPQAVRHRTQIVARQIVETCRAIAPAECRVVSVGSGPARDVELALRELSPDERRQLHVTLLDLDPEALDYARERISPHLADDRLSCARENLFRLARNPKAQAHLQGAHLISCVGFFDYLSAADAASLLATFWRALAPGGSLLAFNFTPANTSRAYMEWIGNWYLIYRSLGELSELARLAGLPADAFRVDSEELGIDAFLIAETAKA